MDVTILQHARIHAIRKVISPDGTLQLSQCVIALTYVTEEVEKKKV